MRILRLQYLCMAVLIIAVAMLCSGCGGKKKKTVIIGEKPVVEEWQAPFLDEFRAWVETVDERDAEALMRKKEIAYRYEDLDQSHKDMVDRFVEAWIKSRTVDSGSPVSGNERDMEELLASSPKPREVAFVGFMAPFKYRIEFRFNDGSEPVDTITSMELSERSD